MTSKKEILDKLKRKGLIYEEDYDELTKEIENEQQKEISNNKSQALNIIIRLGIIE